MGSALCGEMKDVKKGSEGTLGMGRISHQKPNSSAKLIPLRGWKEASGQGGGLQSVLFMHNYARKILTGMFFFGAFLRQLLIPLTFDEDEMPLPFSLSSARFRLADILVGLRFGSRRRLRRSGRDLVR
jgi:hypothetical protein